MILSKDYVISGVKADGTRVFAAVDYHSGGYLYWTDNYHIAKHYADPVRPVDGYMQRDVVAVEVLEATTTATIVSSDDIIARVREKAAAKVAAINEELQKELDLLGRQLP